VLEPPMNYIVEQEQKKKMLNKLIESPLIEYREILDITDAFQIASGQSYAIGNTKALLDYLKDGKSITILNFNHSTQSKILKSAKDLADTFKSIDQYIDLCNDHDFQKYFSNPTNS
jgi:hypothetical protein